jgi:hypothetical protein
MSGVSFDISLRRGYDDEGDKDDERHRIQALIGNDISALRT